MRKLTLLLICGFYFIAFPLNSNATSTSRPYKEYPEQALEKYGWVIDDVKMLMIISINGTASKFISEEDLKRYVKLKMRNFIKKIDLVDSHDGFENSYFTIHLELYKYNDKMEVYYGIMSLTATSSILHTGRPDDYTIDMAIAGSDTQIVSFIKGKIDHMIELFAEDYYYIEDLKEKSKKASKQPE